MLIRFCWILVGGVLYAQQVVAPTPEQVGSARGVNVDDYNITDSFETGYRFAEVGGDIGQYRADVNYGNGIRLLGSSLSIDSKDGHGRWFDKILLNTMGLGNDPYQSATLRVEKNGLYRYDMLWRLDAFYNPGLTISAGEHLMDTIRRMQDHDLTLLPQSRFRVHLGYSRNDQTGPALSSVQEFNTEGFAFPTFQNVRREWNEFRLAADGEFAGFKFTVQRRWEFFTDDSTENGAGLPPTPIAPTVGTTLLDFLRTQPYHGQSPGWLGNLFTNRKHWGLNARMTYVSGSGDFALNEFASGFAAGLAANQQILVSGNAQRPETAADVGINIYPTDKLTIVNNSSVHDTRIVGDSSYTQFDNDLGLGTTLNFRYWGVRTVADATDINYRLTPWIGFYAGYDYSDRLIDTIEGLSLGGPFQDVLYPRSNHLNAGTLGVQIRPKKPLTIRLEGERGWDNLPLTPISDKNYHTLNGRIEYRTPKLQLSTTYREVYNVNSPLPYSAYSSHSREYSANASWSPRSRFTLDASYNKLHLDTVSGLAFFVILPGTFQPVGQSFPYMFLSNIHAGNLGAHFGLSRVADLYVGYSITKDVGDGRSSAVPPGITNPTQVLFDSVQTFPLSFQSPLARLSIRISPKVRWNAGWQFYNYHEQFGVLGYLQNYHANTGYSSILWSF
jgi:hypothetical protein